MELMHKKILIIIPFFGESPKWTPYFLKSCSLNRDIDWLLYGNIHFETEIPSNVRVVRAEISDFVELAEEKLKKSFKITNPYKICDFRPAFACIFSQYIEGYTFWGYGDLDLIYGNISNFILPDHLMKYDVITTKTDHFAGHFTLFRNNDKLNGIYRHIHKCISRLQAYSYYYSLDERCNFIGQRIYREKSWMNAFENTWLSRLSRSVRFRFQKQLRFKHDLNNVLSSMEAGGEIKILRLNCIQSDFMLLKRDVKEWEMHWKNGELIDMITKEAIMYYHFILTKKNKEFKVHPFQDKMNFTITERGIER